METENKTADVFAAFKNEILKRARAASACKEEYGRAYKAESMTELCNVIKDNFHWCCSQGVLTGDLIEAHKTELREQGLFHNESTDKGCLIYDGNATVRAYGDASVEASGNATVRAYDNASVRASGNASVEAYGNASVAASGNASVAASGNASVAASDNASVRASGNASVEAYGNASVEAYGYASVEASGNASVEAYGYAYCSSFYKMDCKISENAIYRVWETNTIYFASDQIKFEKI